MIKTADVTGNLNIKFKVLDFARFLSSLVFNNKGKEISEMKNTAERSAKPNSVIKAVTYLRRLLLFADYPYKAYQTGYGGY